MSSRAYLIDTNVIIGLEDDHAVKPAFAALIALGAKHKVDILVHEAARDDIARDRDQRRRDVSLSKLDKFQTLGKVRGLAKAELERDFGSLPRPNDVVDATLLDTLHRGAADFLVSEDRGLHDRARRHSVDLGRRVLFVADAVQLLRTTYEPIQTPIRYVGEVTANQIPIGDTIFDSLRDGYNGFDIWWRKCVAERRTCWIIEDNDLAGIVVIKEEDASSTDATTKAGKILKVCTFKVRPEKRGLKLGELLLKKVFWYAQANKYDLVYVTTYSDQVSLIDLLEYFGFSNTATKSDGELIYEKPFSRDKLVAEAGRTIFETDRLNYPRFVTGPDIRAFGVPIIERWHDTLYPDLKVRHQLDMFDELRLGGPRQPGNTIRKVYLCRAQSNLGASGSLLFFYKGKSDNPPSQVFTAVGVFEDFASATSTKELMLLTGGRSVYSEAELDEMAASPEKPVKVINYLLAAYIDPPIGLAELQRMGIIAGHPPQSIYEIDASKLAVLLPRLNLGFAS